MVAAAVPSMPKQLRTEGVVNQIEVLAAKNRRWLSSKHLHNLEKFDTPRADKRKKTFEKRSPVALSVCFSLVSFFFRIEIRLCGAQQSGKMTICRSDFGGGFRFVSVSRRHRDSCILQPPIL